MVVLTSAHEPKRHLMHKQPVALNDNMSPLARGDVSEADRGVVASDTDRRYVSRKSNVISGFKLSLP